MIRDHVLNDLADKCAADVSERVRLTASLIDNPQHRFYIALCGVASSAGLAVGYAQQLAPPGADVEDAADTLWTILRPMVIAIAGGGHADLRALLRAAPKGRT